MPHIPRFPPDLDDWLPGRPPLEPPLPRFLFNPWLSPVERQALMAEAGEWATTRAEAMVPPTAGPEAARQAALFMWGNLAQRYGIVTPVAPAPAAPRLRRRRAAPTPTEVAPAPGLTPAQRAQLVSLVRQDLELKKGTRREGAPPPYGDVVEWAGELGASITMAQAADIIKEAF